MKALYLRQNQRPLNTKLCVCGCPKRRHARVKSPKGEDFRHCQDTRCTAGCTRYVEAVA